jgi:hypothetical protein
MAVLTTAQRKKMPAKSFALPGKGTGPSGKGAGSYPIPDASHARNALARVSQHGSSSEKAKVRAKVHAKFPGIGRRHGGPVGYAHGGEVTESGEHHKKEERLIGRLSKYAQHAPPHRGFAQEKKDIAELRRMEGKEKIQKRAHGGPVEPSANEDELAADVREEYEEHRKERTPYQRRVPKEEQYQYREDVPPTEIGPRSKGTFARRQFGGPVKPKMKSSIGPRSLRDTGPRYPKEAASYVR